MSRRILAGTARLMWPLGTMPLILFLVAVAFGQASRQPVYSGYKGIQIGMNAIEVRQKLDHMKDTSPTEDFFVFSDDETAQVLYDGKGNVIAISVSYVGDKSGAPAAASVLGENVAPKPDGGIYKLMRYPAKGYWISYARTAGSDPVTIVTMKKID
jgi:hypothetical protein